MKQLFFVLFWLLAIVQSLLILLQPITWISIPYVQEMEQSMIAGCVLLIGFSLCLFSMQHKKRSWDALPIEEKEDGVTTIDTNVFTSIVKKVLQEKKEIESFRCEVVVREEKREKGLFIKIDIVPVMDESFMFGNISNEIKEEVREAIQNQVSIVIQNITITFREEIL